MAHELHRDPLPMIAATGFTKPAAANGAQGFRLVTLAGSAERGVGPVASLTQEPIGFSAHAPSEAGEAITVHDTGVIKTIAGASLGVGAEVNVASTNGALGPVAAASGSVRYSAGRALSAAAAGEVFSVYVRPKVLSGAA